MKILAFSKYSYDGPSSRYRFYNYQQNFKENGIELTISPLFGQSYFNSSYKLKKLLIVLWAYFYRIAILLKLLLFKKRYNLLLIEYELLPFFPIFFEYLLNKRGIVYIVDYDDAIFHKYDMHQNPIIYYLFKNKIAKVIQYASSVIACNEYLESYILQYNSKILRLPTVVLLDKYKEEMESFKEEEKKFTIGWIGSRTTSIYMLEILPALEKFVKKYRDVQFNLVGFDQTLLSEEEFTRYHINVLSWSEEEEIKNILDFDVGIMPLHNNPWSKGKCGFKLIQYMSCKKPVIASPVGINCSLVKNEINGFLVEGLEEWFIAFEKLYLNQQLREEMAQNNFTKIEQEFNHQKNCQKYILLIQSLG